jgi:hypothetical protein
LVSSATAAPRAARARSPPLLASMISLVERPLAIGRLIAVAGVGSGKRPDDTASQRLGYGWRNGTGTGPWHTGTAARVEEGRAPLRRCAAGRRYSVAISAACSGGLAGCAARSCPLHWPGSSTLLLAGLQGSTQDSRVRMVLRRPCLVLTPTSAYSTPAAYNRRDVVRTSSHRVGRVRSEGGAGRSGAVVPWMSPLVAVPTTCRPSPLDGRR